MHDLSAAIEAALAPRKGKKRGDELDFSCVEHEDNNPSASWNRRKDVWKCQSCGESGNSADLARRLGIHVESPQERSEKAQIVAEYDYRDEEGNLLFQVVRLQPKDFRQRRPGDGGWIWKNGQRQVLYRLPDFLKSPDERAYIPEGEKDVDNLMATGVRATASPGGAVGRKLPVKSGDPIPRQKWRSEYNPFFKGLDVVLLEDNDDAGYCFTQTVARELFPVARSVKILSLPGLPAKGDVSDWLFMGGTRAELDRLADEAPKWEPPAVETGVVGFPETDAGNAELFAHIYGDRVRYDHQRGRWLVWDRHRWLPDADGQIFRWAIEAARARAKAASDLQGDRARAAFSWAKTSESAAKIEAMMKLASKTFPIADRGMAWDANPLLLGCENGIVNLATGTLRPGKREDRVTQSTGIEFDGNAACPRWERFMAEVFPDCEVRSYVRLVLGYCVTGVTKEQFWSLCYGTGANGKSTLVNTVRKAVGDYGAVMSFSTIEKGREQSIPADMAALAGKRIVTVSEAGEYSRINEERVKAITGQEPITARELYKPQFTFRPECHLLVAVNHKPTVRDDSHGYWRRLRLIPFTQTFAVAEDVEETLRSELPGILAWLVQAAADWHKSGFPRIPAAIAVETVEYRDESDELAPFITERCAVRDDATVQASDLYKGYKGWCEQQGMTGREVISSTMFGRRIGERFKRFKRVGVKHYSGIGLIDQGWAQTVPNGDSFEIGDSFLPRSSSEPLRVEPTFRKTVQTVPTVPNENLCPCEECPCPVEAVVDCLGQPFWEDDIGAHCNRCHPRGHDNDN